MIGGCAHTRGQQVRAQEGAWQREDAQLSHIRGELAAKIRVREDELRALQQRMAVIDEQRAALSVRRSKANPVRARVCVCKYTHICLSAAPTPPANLGASCWQPFQSRAAQGTARSEAPRDPAVYDQQLAAAHALQEVLLMASGSDAAIQVASGSASEQDVRTACVA